MALPSLPPLGSEELRSIVAADEAELVFDRFGRDDAWRLGSLLRERAAAAGHAVAIGIVVGGQRLFHTALDGATPEHDAWLERKTQVTLHYHRSSLAVGELFRGRGQTFESDSRLDPGVFAANGGVLPIRVRGIGVIGAVGVSGLPQLDDHAFVASVIREFLAQ